MSDFRGIDKEIKQGLCDLAVRSYPRECCAVLFMGNGKAIDAYCNLPNRSKQDNSYRMDPMELYECEKTYRKNGYEIAGFFHSHPDAPAAMSEEDKAYAIPSMLYLLASVNRNGCSEMRLWRIDEEKEALT